MSKATRVRFGCAAFLVIAVFSFGACATRGRDAPRPPFGQDEFETVLQTLARGWNQNDARLAASVFAEDAIYCEPPDKQLYVGRKEIFEFFGGSAGRSDWMTMSWHNISFNQATQIGAGEFTFAWPGGQVHGMVSISIADRHISRWREYYYASELGWSEFQRPSQF